MFDIHFIHDIGKVVVVHLSIYQKGIRLHTGIKWYQISDESAFSGPICMSDNLWSKWCVPDPEFCDTLG